MLMTGDRKKLFFFFIVMVSLLFLPVLPELKYNVMDYPGGANAAVCVTFDWEDDYPHSIYVPERPADLKGDLPEKTDRILKILDSHDVRATFFVVGIMAREFEDSFKSIKAGGHEIASHGDYHKGYSQLEVVDPQEVPNFDELGFYLQAEKIENAEVLLGSRPKGFRAPGLNYNDATLLALESQGYLYDSSRQGLDRITPFHPEVNGETLKLLEIPVSGASAQSWDLYARVDGNFDSHERWKMDFLDVYVRGGVYVPLMHPAFMGKDSGYLGEFEEFLNYTGNFSIWTTNLGEVASWHIYREQLDVGIRNPRGIVSVLEIDNKNGKMEGLVIEVENHVRPLGIGAQVSYEGGSTKITFPALGEGKKRLVLIRV
jgi:peptidoglycan/xylan/chitin deacetylase (PgdA/CDA1 family)